MRLDPVGIHGPKFVQDGGSDGGLAPHRVRGPFGGGIDNLSRWAVGLAAADATGDGRFFAVALSHGAEVRIIYRFGADAEDAGVIAGEGWSVDLINWDHPAPGGLARDRLGDKVRLA